MPTKILPLPLFALAALSLSASANAADMITLTQTACQFIESENGVDHQYTTTRKADCEAINAKTATGRLQSAAPITLKAGSYTIRVTNRDVPYELGFWIRDADYDGRNPLHKLTKTSVSGGGLTPGVSRDYAVDLAPGEYLYSCPLNTTPDYKLIVTE